MCPPPAEPIRPIGPVAGGVYVDRARLAERVHRRPARGDEEQPEEQQDGRGHARGDAPARAPGTPPQTAVVDPRAYDDHGRHPEGTEEPDVPHVDATA